MTWLTFGAEWRILASRFGNHAEANLEAHTVDIDVTELLTAIAAHDVGAAQKMMEAQTIETLCFMLQDFSILVGMCGSILADRVEAQGATKQ